MFFNFDRRILYVFLTICILTMIGGFFSNTNALLSMLFSIPGVLVAITFHEYAHAFVAYKLGDNTAKSQGRLSLNPLKHMDPFGIVMLLFLGFGWGKPVQIDPRNFNRKMSVEKAEALVAIAGPLMNFILAILFAVFYAVATKFGWFDALSSRAVFIIANILSGIILINIGLGIFNLIPLPPLDGSKVLICFLPYSAKEWFRNNEQIFYIIFLVIWITGIAGSLISPAIRGVYTGLMRLVSTIFGV